MTYSLILTIMLWTGTGAYEKKDVVLQYGSKAACEKAKDEALSRVGEREGAIARCVPKEG